MGILSRLREALSETVEPDEAEARKAFDEMRAAMAHETSEQKQRFYLEVGALLGNKSAAKALEGMGPDPEKSVPN